MWAVSGEWMKVGEENLELWTAGKGRVNVEGMIHRGDAEDAENERLEGAALAKCRSGQAS